MEPVRIELPTIYGMNTVNAYFFTEPEPILVDCGEKTPATWKALETALAKRGLGIKDLKKVVITHAHVDHMGMAGEIARRSNAEIWVNDYCYDWAIGLEEMWEKRVQMLDKLMQKETPPNGQGPVFKKMILSFMKTVVTTWDTIPESQLRRFPIDSQISLGGLSWQVIYTPGHSNTQTCFYQAEKKWLLAADMLLRITPTPVIDVSLSNPLEREKSLSIMLESFQKMAALEIEKVFPGHYEPFGNHRRLIQFQTDRIQMRKEEVFSLIQNGKNRFFDLFDAMYQNRMNMPGMNMLRGYLDLLLEEDKIELREMENFNAYYPKT